jgi:hypothetical protein
MSRNVLFNGLAARGLAVLALVGVGASAVACGGGGGGGSSATLPGLILVDFLQAGQDNVPLNRVLEFTFSSPLDPNTVGPSSLQIREGPSFGQQIFGKYIIQGNRVFFEPALPGLCDGSDGGLKANTDYRIVAVGAPEEFAIRNLEGTPLQDSISEGLTFHTRSDTDPELFEDQKPGALPTVVSTSPVDSAANVAVGSTNKVEIVFSENLDPCTVSDTTVFFHQWAVGPFSPAIDQTPSDPRTWGSGTPTAPPRKIRSTFTLTQDRLLTKLTLTPIFGEFPDNALLVVELSNQVRDFGGNPLVPKTFAFTTEDRIQQTKSLVLEFDGFPPFDQNASTAEVNTARALSKVQGFLLIAGDGDNGPTSNMNGASGPDTSKGPIGCSAPFASVVNDGLPDDFDPDVDVLLSTGNTRNTCNNATDGSAAVTFEYRSFRIRNGVTVRLTGINPAIILVRGDINIEAGGRLLARSDGGGGGPATGNGANGTGQTVTNSNGGTAVAGGGAGGRGLISAANTVVYSENGTAGYGSPDAFLSAGTGGASPVRQGAGRGAVGQFLTTSNGTNRISPSGGGAGHAVAGQPGTANGNGTTPRYLMDANVDGQAGSTYGNSDGRMRTAEAGSGGGGGGSDTAAPFTTGFYYGTGGGGGAGGGFVDLTTQSDIRNVGTIDAAGGRGGNGGGPGAGFYGSGGGGGGGSGGGIRLLTPAAIQIGAGALLTVAGGGGGGSQAYPANGATANNGGSGGVGRIAFEDGDSVISGLGGATIIPTEGSSGFYRGVFDATRFQGGGLRPFAVTQLIDIGPFSPTYLVPVAADFLAGIPAISSRVDGDVGIFIEAQGFTANPDGTPTTISTGWKNVGYFNDSGSEQVPTWVPSATPPPLDVASAGGILPGNTGGDITDLNGRQFVQFRFTFFLPPTIGPFDPGPYVDRWTLRFTYDQ